MSFKTDLFNTKPLLLLAYSPLHDDIEEAEVIEMTNETGQQTDDEWIKPWKERLLNLVVNDKQFERPELALTDLAKHLETNATVLSRVVNRGFAMNFNDFINYYRVSAVMEKLKSGEQKTQTLLGIAFDCGFNSKATFNRAFKKVSGLTPKEWLKNIEAAKA